MVTRSHFALVAVLQTLFVHSAYLPISAVRDVVQERPVDLMVDIVNGYGLRVLNEHNFINENNIAFSPYGLAGILIALYEGVNGDSSFEIRRSLQLPWDRGLIRVGFRDVHRLMKSYFIPEEGFLAGLTFNKQNIQLKENYKNVLNFYGFDFEMLEMNSAEAPENTSTMAVTLSTTTTAASEMNGTSPLAPDTTPAIQTLQTSVPQEITTTQTATSAMAQITTTMLPQNKEDDTGVTTSPPSTTTQLDTSTDTVTSAAATSSIQNEITTASSTEAVSTTANDVPTTTIRQETSFRPTTDSPVTTTLVSLNTMSSPNESVENVASNNEPETTTSSTISTASIASIASTVSTPPSSSVSSTDNPADIESTTASIAANGSSDSAESSGRLESSSIKSIVNSVTEETNTDPTVTHLIMVKENPLVDYLENNLGSPKDDFEIFKQINSITERYPLVTVIKRKAKRSLVNNGAPPSSRYDRFYFHNTYDFNLNSGGLHHQSMFLCSGSRKSKVDYMTYKSYLDFAYLPYLRCLVLKLPLDNDKYYIMIFLPEHEHGLNRLIKDMVDEKTNLKSVHESLEKAFVHAWVPSFMVKGVISLTADLQRLGVRTIFSPRQHDFGPLSDSGDIYVRNVEQSITITIKKYKEMPEVSRGYGENSPWIVQFAATYPFLYFIMDSEVHVALMAGKIIDPLNSRIL